MPPLVGTAERGPCARPSARFRAEGASPLVAEGVTKAYAGVPAVEDVDLAVASGAVAGLVGPNGCGKTTTLRIVVGLARPDVGRVTVAGLAQDGAPAVRRRVAYVPDEPSGLDELTVGEYLRLFAALYSAGGAFEARAASLLDAFALAARGASPLGALSHGQRRLVTMVAAFALRAPLVVVDEATAALDPEAVVVLRESLRALAAGGAGVLLATQDLHFAETVCDDVFLLSGGRVVAAGPVSSVLARYGGHSLEDAFLAAVGRAAPLDALRRALDAG